MCFILTTTTLYLAIRIKDLKVALLNDSNPAIEQLKIDYVNSVREAKYYKEMYDSTLQQYNRDIGFKRS